MSEYIVQIKSISEKCPFDAKRRSKVYCEVCKALNDPCPGIGNVSVISEKKVDRYTMQEVLKLISTLKPKNK